MEKCVHVVVVVRLFNSKESTLGHTDRAKLRKTNSLQIERNSNINVENHDTDALNMHSGLNFSHKIVPNT